MIRLASKPVEKVESDGSNSHVKGKHRAEPSNSVPENDCSSSSMKTKVIQPIQPPTSQREPKDSNSFHFVQKNNATLDSKANRSASESCPEFRSGYRIQTKAYERQSETPPSTATVNYRRSSNTYIDRLKQFYKPEHDKLAQFHKTEPFISRRVFNFSSFSRMQDVSSSSLTNDNQNQSMDKLPSVRKHHKCTNSNTSVTKPDTQAFPNSRSTTFTPKPSHKVVITLTSPSGKTSRASDDMIYNNTSSDIKHTLSHLITAPHRHNHNQTKPENTVNLHHTTKSRSKEVPLSSRVISPSIPPPVPILIPPLSLHAPTVQSPRQLKDGCENSPKPLSPNDAQSILEAVQNLGSRRSANGKNQQRRRRFTRTTLEKDSKNLAMKMSLPCCVGCCYCVYASLLGPVKIYLTRSEKPKKEPRLLGIKDGNGRPVIPVSRKEDITGLVYDAHNHSFHPPTTRGQRPMFPSASKGNKVAKAPVSKEKDVIRKNGGKLF